MTAFAIFIRHDVSTEDNWVAVIQQTLEHFGRLDILVNNAGYSASKGAVAGLTKSVTSPPWYCTWPLMDLIL